MVPIISRRAHGFADYAYVALAAVAPKLFGFENKKQAASLCYTLSAATLLYTLSTKAEWGVIKAVPYKTHLLADFGAEVANLATPWLLDFSANRRARNVVIAFGLTGIAASLLSGVFSDAEEQ